MRGSKILVNGTSLDMLVRDGSLGRCHLSIQEAGGQTSRLSGKKTVPGSESSKCEGSEKGGYLTCLRESKRASMAGEE